MAAEVWIALIGVGGTLTAPVVTSKLQQKLAEREAAAAHTERRRRLVRAAADSFMEARLVLDAAIKGERRELDGIQLYLPIASNKTALELEFGPEHAVSKAYADAVDNWANALNLAAATDFDGRRERIAGARNAAEDAKRVFLAHAAEELRT